MTKVLPLNLNIFIGNLPKHLTREEISSYFQALEDIERIQLPVENKSIENKGYMYLKCKNEESFLRLMRSTHKLGGATLVLREYYEQVDKSRVLNLKKPNSIIFLKNIPPEITHTDLFENFSTFGAVLAVLAFRGKKQDKKIFLGYVQFEEKESISLVPAVVNVRSWKLNWKRYKSKELSETEHLEEKFKVEFKHKNFQQKILHDPKSPVREFYANLDKTVEETGYRHSFQNLCLNRNFTYGKNIKKIFVKKKKRVGKK